MSGAYLVSKVVDRFGLFLLAFDIASPTVEAFWILVSIINSTYTSVWDIKMDWGLLNMDSQHYLLRDDLVFYKWVRQFGDAYLIMQVNLFPLSL